MSSSGASASHRESRRMRESSFRFFLVSALHCRTKRPLSAPREPSAAAVPGAQFAAEAIGGAGWTLHGLGGDGVVAAASVSGRRRDAGVLDSPVPGGC
eukprot:6394343-Prymnesium_polylepis.1